MREPKRWFLTKGRYHVYALLKNKEIIYVGCTTDPVRRIREHIKVGREFDGVKLLAANNDFKTARALEREYQQYFNVPDKGTKRRKARKGAKRTAAESKTLRQMSARTGIPVPRRAPAIEPADPGGS